MATDVSLISTVIEALGGPSRAAEKLGLASPSVVLNWRLRKSIPADRVIAIEKLTGIPRQKLRPDVFGEAA